MADEILLAFLERDRIDNPLALQALEARLDDLPFGGIHHDRHPCDVRLALQQVEEPRHHFLAIDQAVIEADIDHIRAIGDLLPDDFDRGLQFAGADELGELGRTGDVGALANHHEAVIGGVVVSLRAGKPEGVRDGFHNIVLKRGDAEDAEGRAEN